MFVYHTLHTMEEPSNLNKITLKYEIGVRLVLTQLVTQAQRFSHFMIPLRINIWLVLEF